MRAQERYVHLLLRPKGSLDSPPNVQRKLKAYLVVASEPLEQALVLAIAQYLRLLVSLHECFHEREDCEITLGLNVLRVGPEQASVADYFVLPLGQAPDHEQGVSCVTAGVPTVPIAGRMHNFSQQVH